MDQSFGLEGLGGGLTLLSFDEDFYLAENPDVAAAIADGAFDGDAEDHYIEFGDAEGRDPNAFFDVAFYFVSNLDVAALVDIGAFETSLSHYETIGVVEGRDNLPLPSLSFDASFYLVTNPDVLVSIVNGSFGEAARPEASAFAHFVFFGAAEGRAPNALIPSPEATLELARLSQIGDASDGDFPTRTDFVEGRAEIIEDRAEAIADALLPPFDPLVPLDSGGTTIGFSFGGDDSEVFGGFG